MIGRKEPEKANQAREEPAGEPNVGSAIHWGMGCLVGAAALAGVVLMVLLLAFYIQPPTWVQVVLGIVLAVGGAVLAWLVATALSRAQAEQARRRPPTSQ